MFANMNVIVLILLNYFVRCNLLIIVPNLDQDLALQIKLPQGTIQGRIDHTASKKLHYYSFTGIPYAIPPIGQLRFKGPLPLRSWQGVLNASRRNVPSCIQITPTFLTDFPESEDCLYINVFTPVESLNDLNTSYSLPVMAWIYGGAFLSGSLDTSYFGPDYLLEQKVIVVQFAYRLGALGFLSTEDLESPGNYGLKDQHLAIQWIKDNIRYFGGNSDNIIIFGESAGGASVQYQLLYLKNEGLIKGAISQSGSALNTWAFQRYPRKVAFDLGLTVGIKASRSKDLMDYLRIVPVDDLKNAAFKTSVQSGPIEAIKIIRQCRYLIRKSSTKRDNATTLANGLATMANDPFFPILIINIVSKNSMGIIHGIPFAPTIEPDHADAFITNKTHQLLQEGKFLKVPYILGFNSGEVSLLSQALRYTSPFLQFYNVDPRVLVPYGMKERAGYEIKKRYFDKTMTLAEQYIKYIGDAYFHRPIIESAKLFGQHVNTYLYIFEYEGYLGRNALGFKRIDDYKGVTHTEEMAYIWCRKYLMEPSSMDQIVRSRLVKMWTNFAKTGIPTPEPEELLQNITWTNVSSDLNYLTMSKRLTLKDHIMKDATEFWDNLYSRYGKPPFDTY